MPSQVADGTDEITTIRYSFAHAPLTPGGMVPLIREFLVNEKPLKRNEICERVIKLHLDRGGAPTDGLTLKIKRALETLKESREIESVAFGRYIAVNLNHDDIKIDVEVNENTSEIDLTGLSEGISVASASLVPLDEIGEGPQKVYVYFFENDRDLAQFRGQNYWPCKIGYTTTSVTERILGQGVTAMHSLPLIGLIIHTQNADLVERSIHNALRLAGRTPINSSRVGVEWFNTTPHDVRSWYMAFTESLSLLNEHRT